MNVARRLAGGVEGPVSEREPRFSGFDGLRAVAATLIVFHHAGFHSAVVFDDPFGPYLARTDVGVPIFFVISGFLLYRPFVAASLDGAAPPDAGRFWLRRALRIFPAYWVALVLQLVIGGIIVHDAEGFVRHATLTQIYDKDWAFTGITQSWSLATEITFYAVLPLLAALTARVFRGGTIDQRARGMLACCASLYLLSVAWRVIVHVVDSSAPGVSSMWLPSLADHFALGMALAVISAWAQRSPRARERVLAVGRRTAAWWITAVVAFLFVSTQLDLPAGLRAASFEREMTRQALYGVIGLALVAPVALHPGAGALRRTLDSRLLVGLGVLSYGIYLWHQFFMYWVGRWFDWPLFAGHFAERLVLAYVLAVGAAWLSYRLVERPAARFRR